MSSFSIFSEHSTTEICARQCFTFSVYLNGSGVADVGCKFREVYWHKNSLPFWNYRNFFGWTTCIEIKEVCKAKGALRKPAEASHGRKVMVHFPIFTWPPCTRQVLRQVSDLSEIKKKTGPAPKHVLKTYLSLLWICKMIRRQTKGYLWTFLGWKYTENNNLSSPKPPSAKSHNSIMNDSEQMSWEGWAGVDLKGKVGLQSEQTWEIVLSLLKCGRDDWANWCEVFYWALPMKAGHVLLNPNVLTPSTTKVTAVQHN